MRIYKAKVDARVSATEGGPAVTEVPAGELVREEPERDLQSQFFQFVRPPAGALTMAGWATRGDFELVDVPVELPPIFEPDFLRQSFSTAGTFTGVPQNQANPAVSRFMIAVALAVSGMKNVIEGARIGPFQYTSEQWSKLVGFPGPPPDFLPVGVLITSPRNQLAAAAVEMHLNGKALSALHQADPAAIKAPFPDYLALFHAHLLGPNVAYALWKARQAGAPPPPTLEKLIEDAAPIAVPPGALPLLEERPKFFLTRNAAGQPQTAAQGGKPLDVPTFLKQTEEMLAEAMVESQRLHDLHVPEAAEGGVALWMAFARDAEARGVTEDNQAGRDEIATYFDETDHPKVQPGSPTVPDWCAAFVAKALASVGGPIAASVPQHAGAAAATWAKWGTRDVSGTAPVGAIVTISNDGEAGKIGHVGFFVESDKTHVTLLGGNQSKRVKESKFPIGSVARVRWFGAIGGGGGAGPVPALAIVGPAVAPTAFNTNFQGFPAGREEVARFVVATFASAGYAAHHQIAALANAIKESSLDPTADNITATEESYGLFQCNRKGGGLGKNHSPDQLKDRDVNIKLILVQAAAVKLVNTMSTATAVDRFVRKVENTGSQNTEVQLRTAIANQLRSGIGGVP